MAGILGGAGHVLAVLAAILTGAPDAGQGAKGGEDWVPHLPVGVCLPPVHTGWDEEGRKGGVSDSAPPGSVVQQWVGWNGGLGNPLPPVWAIHTACKVQAKV